MLGSFGEVVLVSLWCWIPIFTGMTALGLGLLTFRDLVIGVGAAVAEKLP